MRALMVFVESLEILISLRLSVGSQNSSGQVGIAIAIVFIIWQPCWRAVAAVSIFLAILVTESQQAQSS